MESNIGFIRRSDDRHFGGQIKGTGLRGRKTALSYGVSIDLRSGCI
jgi:hypothetical protein